MRVRPSDPALARSLIRHFRSRNYLAVAENRAIAIVPLNAVGARADRLRFQRDLEDWQAEHPGALTSVEPG